MSQFDRHNERFEQMDKKINAGFNIALVVGLLWALVIMSAIGVGIYLALKHWG